VALAGPEAEAGPAAGAGERPRARGESAAYAIYTSGSTGRPKGAVNTHRGVRNRILWMQEAYGLESRDVVLQKTPFGFDVSVWEFLWPLATGALLAMARPGGHQDPSYLRQLVVREGVTTLHFVPSMLQLFLDQDGLEECRSLRQVMASGEALPAELARRFFARLPAAELHNLYGPTEAAIDVSAWRCTAAGLREPLPIGRPIANLRLAVLDRALRPVPLGVVGELAIGGVGLARGYWRRPDLTAERFVPEPLGGEPGGRLYRTGDLARWRSSGELEYLGRVDFQVKVRGVRIELGEIEAALASLAGVREAVVTARGAGGDRRLVAYVVPAGGAPGSHDPAELRRLLRRTLPEAMVPQGFAVLPALPLTASGKVDRQALPEPEAEPRAASAFRPPRSAVERAVAGIWQRVLGRDRVGREESFFDLGGHSLRLVEVQSGIRRELGVELAILDLFQHPTVAAMARLVRRQGAGPDDADEGPQASAAPAAVTAPARSPSSPCRGASPAPPTSRSCGATCAAASSRSAASAARRCSPTGWTRRSWRGRAGFPPAARSPRSTASTRPSSASARARRRCSTLSSGSSWSAPGRCSSGPAARRGASHWRRRRGAAAGRGSASSPPPRPAPMRSTTWPRTPGSSSPSAATR
jgi:amino acid adenylation domain-containing protein